MSEVFAHGYAGVFGVGADLPITANDAQGVANILRDPTRCAYPADQVQLLIGEDAHRDEVLAALDWLAIRTQDDRDATVIVFFSGHGIELGNYYLLPFGWDLDDLPNTAIASGECNERLRRIQSRKLVVILDCCHAGGMAEAKGLPLVKSPVPLRLFDALRSGSGRVVIASSRKDEVSYAGHPYSVFTGALLEALAGYGAFENDGYARVLDAALWVGCRVPERTDEQQHPIIKVSTLEDNFALAYYAGGANEPRPLRWTATVLAQRKAWKRALRDCRDKLLLIEERMSEYVEFAATPLPLIREKWRTEKLISELEERLGLCPRGGAS
jgi:uncharacterized caspase-like protein